MVGEGVCCGTWKGGTLRFCRRKGSTLVGVIKGSRVYSEHGALDGVAIGNERDGLEGRFCSMDMV